MELKQTKKLLISILITFFYFSKVYAIDYLVIYNNELEGTWVSDFSEWKTTQGYHVSLVEITSGSIEDIKMIIDNHCGDLEFVLLVGDANEEPEELKHTIDPSSGNFIPFQYQEYDGFELYIGDEPLIDYTSIPSDDYYVSGCDGVSTGRIPAETPLEVQQWLNKVIIASHSFNDYEDWKNNFTIFSHNIDNPANGGRGYRVDWEDSKLTERYLQNNEINTQLINSIDFPEGVHDVGSRGDAFENIHNNGTPLTYLHGVGSDWRFLNGFYAFGDPNCDWNFTNIDKPSFLLGNSCSIGKIQESIDGEEKDIILEKLLFHPTGGIVGAIAPAYVTDNMAVHNFSDLLFTHLLFGANRTIGEELSQMKYEMDKCRYMFNRGWHTATSILYGDPSMSLLLFQYVNNPHPPFQDIVPDYEYESQLNESIDPIYIRDATVWNGSIIIDQNIIVSNRSTLTIRPGTGVFFKPGARLVVEEGAVLNAIGTEAFPIVFVPATEDNYQAGYWSGIASESEGEVNLTYCEVKGAVTGLSATKSTGTIASSEFSKNKIGIALNYADGFSIDHCLITDNHTGVQLLYSSPGVAKNTIANNTHYGLYAFRSKSEMANNTFEHNGIYGLKISNRSTPTLTAVHSSNNPQVNNVFESNGSASVWIDLTSRPDLGRYMGINGQIYGGFNQFKNRGRDVDILNNAETVSANVNWWENMNIAGQGSIDTEPTADQLFGPPARTMASQSDSLPPALGQAYSLELEGNYTDAITLYETVLAEAPDGDYAVEALYGIIRCYSELNDMITLDNTLLNYYTTYSGLQVGIASYDYSITINTQLQQYSEALNRSIDLLDKVAGTEDEAHVLLEQGILYSFMAGDSTGSGQKQVSPGSAQRLALATYETVLDNYSETSSAEIAAWFLGKTYVSSRPEELDASVPNKFALHQNYPNPFNPNTTISYDLPEQSIVSLTIYDILGREVKTLVNGARVMGKHTAIWDGKDRFGIPVSTGMYIYRITAVSKESEKHFVQNHKMVLMK